MKHRRIKKYAIHILAIQAIKPDLFDIPLSRCAIIACTERENSNLDLFPDAQKCVMPFADVEVPDAYMAINGAHARAIIRFLDRLPDEVTDLYICCSKGSSRSPAVAAAVLRMSGRSDRDVWDNPFYVPNSLVYQTVCREFGLFAPDWCVRCLVERNRQCYLESVEKGSTGKYERWQILE
ncbi:hypothetical protein [Butyrivibrio sp. AE2032]|uniref:hypothetical protein n=1 Tax=Butyrivibrio sp. AE2032 TaxID=1458463 RepID=UPI000553BE09|nr:hypothetical protein [Butyrivibrio sp. AE2032]